MIQFLVAAQQRVHRLLHRDQGQGMVEYGLILALIAIVAIVALTFLGHTVGNVLDNVGNNLVGA